MERETKEASGQLVYNKLVKNLDAYKQPKLFSDQWWSCMEVEGAWAVVHGCLRGKRRMAAAELLELFEVIFQPKMGSQRWLGSRLLGWCLFMVKRGNRGGGKMNEGGVVCCDCE